MSDKYLTDEQRRSALRVEVRKQMANGASYDQAFRDAMTLRPELLGDEMPRLQGERPARRLGPHGAQIINDGAAEYSMDAGRQFQNLLDAWFKDHPNRKRENQADFDFGFNAVAQAHPEVMAKMHRPGRAASNLWRRTGSDGYTPGRKQRTIDRPLTTPAERASVA